MGGGALLTITVIAAILGIPLAIFGWFCWSFGKKNIAAVEAGYAQYTASLGLPPDGVVAVSSPSFGSPRSESEATHRR